MRHWLQVGIRNWRVKPGRTLGAIAAVALGVGVVIWVTSAYESVRLALRDRAWMWIGKSHLSLESMYGLTGTVLQPVADEARELPNVKHVTSRLHYDGYILLVKNGERYWPEDLDVGNYVEAIGIKPETEYYFHNYQSRLVGQGRVLKPDDKNTALLEHKFAQKLGLEVGDHIEFNTERTNEQGRRLTKSKEFEIVGLIERRRIAMQQPPAIVVPLEQLKSLAMFADDRDRVTSIEIMVKDTSYQALHETERKLRQIGKRYPEQPLIQSAEGKIRRIEASERQSRMAILLFSSVALFTAFFIILSTLSMGMVERVGQLGTLRCVGTTRLQLALLVLAEAVPIGLAGMLAGIPVGIGLVRLSVSFAPQYIGYFIIAEHGIALALAGGAFTTLAGAALPAIQAMRVSPLNAARPQSRGTPMTITWIAAVIGIGMIVTYMLLIDRLPAIKWFQPQMPPLGISLLYCGYALVTPALIKVIGWIAVRFVSAVLRIRHQLLSDQIGRAAWRSAAICSGLMVGLSLIVSMVVFSKTLSGAWNFPAEFAEAFVYVNPPVNPQKAERVMKTGGLAEQTCGINERISCTVLEGWPHFPWTHYVVGEPDEFFALFNPEFVQGDQQKAIARLKSGGHILVTPEFVRTYDKGLGDRVRVRVETDRPRVHSFEIAGVVTSPSLEIAANWFNMQGQMAKTSVFVIMGTFEDAKRIFGIPKKISLFLVNFDLPKTTPPEEFTKDSPPDFREMTIHQEYAMFQQWRSVLPERIKELETIQKRYQKLSGEEKEIAAKDLPLLQKMKACLRQTIHGKGGQGWDNLTPGQRWNSFREQMTMKLVAVYSGAKDTIYQSVGSLKRRIDKEITRATLLLTSVPIVALLVAALGVGNLMMSNVTSRSRQIALLRAVGTTKSQIIRLVIGEALVLGTIGSCLGIALGMHAAATMNVVFRAIWGFDLSIRIPWQWVGLSIAFTLGVCLLAGILPARRAARNNIIDAMQTT
jgi:ABC-type lipoprotein release transport system permease subunit